MSGSVSRACLFLLSLGVTASPAQAQTPATAAASSPNSAVSAPPASATAAPPARAPNIVDADRLLRAGRFDAAIEQYDGMITAGNEPALGYAGLARAYLKQKRVSDAAAAAHKALELAPAYPAVRTAYAELLFRQGRLIEAEHEFAALVRAEVVYPRAYLGLARIYQSASYYRQAKRFIDIAHDRDPDDPDIRRFWLRTLSVEDRIKALKGYLSTRANDDSADREKLALELAFLEDDSAHLQHRCHLTSKVTSVETALKQMLYDPRHIRGYGLNIKLNGGTSASLLLDTGASGILVDRKVAEKAGLHKIVDTKIGGIGDKGAASGYVGYADSIKIGSLDFEDCYVEVIDKKSAVDDDGLIGADVFSHFLVDLDFAQGKFRLSELPRRPEEPQTEASLVSQPSTGPQFHDRYVAPEMKSYTPVYRFGHMLLLWTQVSQATPRLFLLDSGSVQNTISPAAASEVTKVYGDSRTVVKGLSGRVNDVFRGNDVTLSFGHLRQENQDIIAFDTTGMSDSVGVEVSGTLGFTLLRMLDIKIDYRDGLVDLEFDKKRWH